jgi:tetratricopeptide (TPR) repeat protein
MAYMQVAWIREGLGQSGEAEEAYRQAVRLFGQLTTDFPDRVEYRKSTTGADDRLALQLARQGRHEEAEKAHQEAEHLFNGPGPTALPGPEFLTSLGTLHSNQGLRLRLAKRYEVALQHSRRAVELLSQVPSDAPNSDHNRGALASAWTELGNDLGRTKRLGEATAAHRKALESRQPDLTRHPADVGLRTQVGSCWRNLGRAHRLQEAQSDARQAYREAQKLFGPLAEDFPTVPQ